MIALNFRTRLRKIPGAPQLITRLKSLPLLGTKSAVSVIARHEDGADTARGAFFANLQAVTEALKNDGIEYFLVSAIPNERPYSIALSEKNRDRFLKTLHTTLYKNHPDMYLGCPPPRETKGVRCIGLLDNPARNARAVTDAIFVRLWTNRSANNGDIVFDTKYGCDVDFWQEGSSLESPDDIPTVLGVKSLDDLRGGLIAPRPNRVTRWIPSTERKPVAIELAGHSYQTLECFTYRLLNEIDFPIDIVFSWVDGNDPIWRKKMLKYKAKYTPNAVNNSASRYESRDELRYALRSVHMFASHFVRNIYIVTDGQRPNWLKGGQNKVRVIDHKDIFATKGALPVFNSHAINSQCHHIEGLSEHYLYLNDDVFFGKIASASDFFFASGIMKVNFSSAQFGIGKPLGSETSPSSAGKNARNLILKSENRYITNKTVHAPLPQRNSIAHELEKKYSSAVKKTSRSKFRDPEDIAFANTTHLSYAIAKGMAVPHKNRARTVNISDPSSVDRLEHLKTNRIYSTFCLNDTNTAPDDIDRVNKVVVGALEKIFPIKAPWEK